jgi:flagellar biosynthetic protein FliR
MTEALAAIDFSGWMARYGVVLLRVTGLFVFLPIFGSDVLPIRIRLELAAVLALAFLPLAPGLAAPPADLAGWVLVGVHELSAGLGLGLAARMVFAGMEGAAGLVAGQSGFALASMVDPASGDQGLAPGIFQNLLAIALFLAADLHHLLIRGFLASYDVLPPAAALPSFALWDQGAIALGTRMFEVTVQLAAPALIVTVAVDLVLGLVGRAMQQIPIILVGYPFKLAAGLVAMAVLASATGSAMGWIGRTVASDGAAVLASLAGR